MYSSTQCLLATLFGSDKSSGDEYQPERLILYHQLYLCPSVNEQWTEMIAAVHNEIGDQPVVLLGDGRSDSPGFSTKFCVYSLIDNATHKIIDVRFVDKREVHLKSPCIEKVGLQRSLSAIRELNVLELVTDASISIT